MPPAYAGLGADSRPVPGGSVPHPGDEWQDGKRPLRADPDRLGGSPGVRLDVSPGGGLWPGPRT